MDMIEEIIAAVERWLLSSKVQFADGPHSGGVAGWLNEDDQSVFIYPEIVGYFLTWLTFLAEKKGDDSGPGRRAAEAVRWVDHHYSGETPPATRIYLLPGQEEDWRNAGIFVFDLAMIARGLGVAK